jgi:O-antigen/teichoic acid export membrane protein
MSVFKNYIYNTLFTISTYILGFLVFPHISRVFGLEKLGVLSYVENSINYFVLLATLGINYVGVKSISQCGNDLIKRSKVFSELFLLSIILILIANIFYLILIFTLPQFQIYKEFYFIGLIKLTFTPLLIEWFFTGMSNFKYIALRSIILKLSYSILILFFVKDSNDISLYFYLSSGIVFLNFLINISYSFKFVSLTFKNIKPFFYLQQVLKLGMFQILVSLYTTLNIFYLGYVSTYSQVGIYYTAIKFYTLLNGFILPFTSIMLPKMSSLISDNNHLSYNNTLIKSVKILITFSLPIIILGIILAPEIIKLISGNDFEGAILPMRIIMPIILVSGLSQTIAFQILIPNNKENILLIITPFVSFIAIILNLIIVRKYGAVGTAFVFAISECLGLLCGLIYTLKYNFLIFPFKYFVINFLVGIPYIFICMIVYYLCTTPLISLIFSVLISIIYFFFIQIKILNNTIVTFFFNKLIIKLI